MIESINQAEKEIFTSSSKQASNQAADRKTTLDWIFHSSSFKQYALSVLVCLPHKKITFHKSSTNRLDLNININLFTSILTLSLTFQSLNVAWD